MKKKNSVKAISLIILIVAFCIGGVSTNTTGQGASGAQNADEGITRGVSRFPANLESYKPMPIPEPRETKVMTQPEYRWVSYNLVTSEEIIHDSPMLSDNIPDIGRMIGGKKPRIIGQSNNWESGGPQEGGGSENFSSLTWITNPEDYPWCVNVKIFMTFPGGNYVGSGVLVDSMHVLTAGHYVYYAPAGGWATSIVVVPAYENGWRPYGDANAVQLHSWTGWTIDGNFDHDIGMIDLDRPIGALTGWHGYGYNNNPAFYTGSTFNNPGYPAASPYNGQYMYYWYGTYDYTESVLGVWYGNEVGIYSQGYGGQSGSGAYIIDSGNRYVYTVLSNGNSSVTNFPRITSAKFYHIRDDFIAGDTPSTFDLIPLDVKTSPASVTPGSQLSSMSYVVHNYSSASWSGTVYVDKYLSTNDNISTSDTFLQSGYFTWSFGPKSSVRVTVSSPPTIPAGTAAGSYYIGVILDISDYNYGNNDSDGQDASPITVIATLPTVTTNSVTSITTTSAVCGGNVTSDGGATVTARGVCWSTSPNPTIYNSKTVNGSGTGSFTSNISGLSPNTTYHVRAYATNSVGTSYGVDRPFTTQTPVTPPTVTTNSVTSITTTSAVCGGNVTSDGGATVTARGVCWSTSPNPTIYNSKTVNGSGTGSFTSNITGLNPATTYHVRAYATNSAGTSYGVDRQFTTDSLPPVEDINVTAPNGGENWPLGATQTITWTSAGLTGNVKIVLYQNGSKVGAIAVNIPITQGSYTWTVGNHDGGTASPGTGYVVRVKSMVNTAYYDDSDGSFTISGLTMTSPNGGESWNRGTAKAITWASAGLTGNVKLVLYQNGAKVGGIVVDIPVTQGSYTWTVGNYDGGTASPGSGYVVRVKSMVNTACYDDSDASFTITDTSPLTLTSPNGGESWDHGTTKTITWTSSGLTGNVKLVLYRNGTKIGGIVVDIPVSQGSYTWTVGDYTGGTASPGTGYVVRVKSMVNTAYYDDSDGGFTISVSKWNQGRGYCL
jgi:V8-like Glu-specific endopeptidase